MQTNVRYEIVRFEYDGNSSPIRVFVDEDGVTFSLADVCDLFNINLFQDPKVIDNKKTLIVKIDDTELLAVSLAGVMMINMNVNPKRVFGDEFVLWAIKTVSSLKTKEKCSCVKYSVDNNAENLNLRKAEILLRCMEIGCLDEDMLRAFSKEIYLLFLRAVHMKRAYEDCEVMTNAEFINAVN